MVWPRRVTAFLFDFNGVLVDDERVHFAAFRDVLAGRGVALAESAYFAEYLAFDDATAFRAMLRDAGRDADDATVAELVREKLPLYLAAVRRELTLFPGGFELMRACAASGDVAIVSGALRAEIDFILGEVGCADVPRTIVAADDVAACKPDPAGYLEALRRLAVSARDAVVVEDSVAGIESGHAAGCAVVAVAHSYPLETLRAAPADVIVPRIAELDVARLLAAASAARRSG